MEAIKKLSVKKTLSSDKCCLCTLKTDKGFVKTPSQTAYNTLAEILVKIKKWDPKQEQDVPILTLTADQLTSDKIKDLKVKWHLECYKRITKKDSLRRMEKKYNAQQLEAATKLQETKETVPDMPIDATTSKFTRSKTTPLKKEVCVFCDKESTKRQQLRQVSYESSGHLLKKAVEISKNEVISVRLSECISPGDAHALDICYHKNCWNKNVTNVLRTNRQKSKSEESSKVTGSSVEFLNCIKSFLREGNITCMADLHSTYLNICQSNEIDIEITPLMSRRDLKLFLQEEIPDIIFSAPKRRNESERVSLKPTVDAALQETEDQISNLSVLLKAALILRKVCLSAPKWTFQGSLDDTDFKLPEELQLFFKWCLCGTGEVTSVVERQSEIDNRASRLSQILMYECLTKKQSESKTSTQVQRTRELPLQMGLGLAIHKKTRSKAAVDILSNLGLSVDYSKIVKTETGMAKSVLKKITDNDGLYIPPEFEEKEFVHFAADNLDFHEDTPDGKKTLHATVLVGYQKKYTEQTIKTIAILDQDSLNTITIPSSIYSLDQCHIRKNAKPDIPNVIAVPATSNESLTEALEKTYCWLLATKDCIYETAEDKNKHGLTWSAYNSVVCPGDTQKTTIALFPIINVTPMDTSVQLTFLNIFEKVRHYLKAPGERTVVTVDLGLYKPLLKLLHEKKLENILLIPGDLHITMAMLRAIGCFIEFSGIPESWIECGLYSEQVTNKILEGKPVRRSIEAHIVTLEVFFSLYLEELIKHFPDLKDRYDELGKLLADSFQNTSDQASIRNYSHELHKLLEDTNFCSKVKDFNQKEGETKPTFSFAIQYMNMVTTLLAFITSVRSRNWNLRNAALKDFLKYFFALNLRNYAPLISYHLSELSCIEHDDPVTWNHLSSGLWAPNKNGIGFCSLGADEALEQENRKMKVSGGLIGITLQPETLTKFFLNMPYLNRLSNTVLDKLGKNKPASFHHELHNTKKSARICQNMKTLKKTVEDFTNPFSYDENHLINLVTKRIATDVVCKDICAMSDVGEKIENNFLENRIKNKTTNFWDPLKSSGLSLNKSMLKKATAKTKAGVIQLKHDMNMFSKCVLICRSRPELNLKDIVGNFELTAIPRSLFHPDGSMIHLQGKSKLMHILAEIGSKQMLCNVNNANQDSCFSIAVIDGMAEVQMLSLKDCTYLSDLSEQFSNKVLKKYGLYSEIHVVFDTYINGSLKSSERIRRQAGTDPIRYHVDDKTNIKNTNIKKLLSHTSTKEDITQYFSHNLISSGNKHSKKVVCSFKNTVVSTATSADMTHLESSHEEADAKIILHSLDASKRGAKILRIFSPDTDVLVLALRRASLLPNDSVFICIGSSCREIPLHPIYESLGQLKAEALPGLHALSGADVTGSFKGKAKISFWKKFLEATTSTLQALASLGKSENLSDSDIEQIEMFICSLYSPSKKVVKSLAELRWWLFTQRQVSTESMPPTRAALKPAIERCHYQCIEWNRDTHAHPNLPPPTNYGWKFVGDGLELEPIMCSLPCAPEEILNLIRCSCKKNNCSQRCKCSVQNMLCTEMCECEADPECCSNTKADEKTTYDTDSDYALDSEDDDD